VRTFHLPLPVELHEDLRREAIVLGRPATEIVREALSQWLDARRRARIAEEIRSYAMAEAGGPFDLDPDLEDASLEHLLAADSA
jgi:hypothetical protein